MKLSIASSFWTLFSSSKIPDLIASNGDELPGNYVAWKFFFIRFLPLDASRGPPPDMRAFFGSGVARYSALKAICKAFLSCVQLVVVAAPILALLLLARPLDLLS